MSLTAQESPFGFDPMQPGFRDDPYAVYARQRDADPVHHSSAGIWTLTKYSDCETTLRDPRIGHGQGLSSLAENHLSFVTLNPPDHTRLRGLVSLAFTPRAVRELRPRIRDLVDGLLAPLRGAGEFDLIQAFAQMLPVMVISELIGVPAEDRSRLVAWSEAFARGLDPDFLQTPEQLRQRDVAKLEFDNYFIELIAARRGRPTDDLLSGLVDAEQDGDKLTERELLDILSTLLAAGHETAASHIGTGALALLRHPDQLRYLREHPEQVPAATEELLRYDPPLQFALRSALADTEIAGYQVKADEVIFIVLGSANRDPGVFQDPDRLDVTRKVGKHMAFGQGIHFCIGAPLARMEAQLAFAGIATALPDLELLDERPVFRENFLLRGLTALRVRA